MPNIKRRGEISVPIIILDAADKIKHQNYKTNTPKKFHIQPSHGEVFNVLAKSLSDKLTIPVQFLDIVYFSVCNGAEPHIDMLDPKVFEPITFVIPVILPKGKSTITAENETVEVDLFNIYEFNHEKIHSMDLEDTESGCVVLMVAVRKH